MPTSANDGPAPTRRAYRSTLREERAAETRRRIVRAARELFTSEGFASTTVAMIAARAEVAAPTVYATFGSKSAIVGAMLEGLEQEAQSEAWDARIRSEQDPRRRLALYAAFLRALYSGGQGIWPAAMGASGDPAVADLKERGEQRSRAWLVPIVDALAEADALAVGLSREDAVDRAWMLSALELYFRGTAGLGWDDDQYEAWLAQSLLAQLTRPAA